AIDYEAQFARMKIGNNIHIHYPQGLLPYELAQKVNAAACVVICCLETKYTVGLTTVVEAMALGLPIICSRNPQIPIDVDAEGCGISVPYGDKAGWRRAIKYMLANPEEARRMGQRGRVLAERMYNDDRCAAEVAAVLKAL
ncbi:MAG TPA: glycosyltransferase, partial [Prevotella sp.]